MAIIDVLFLVSIVAAISFALGQIVGKRSRVTNTKPEVNPETTPEVAPREAYGIRRDWTVDPTGHANGSPEFLKLCGVVEETIRNGAFDIVAGRVGVVAGTIMAKLAHRHGLGPCHPPRKPMIPLDGCNSQPD